MDKIKSPLQLGYSVTLRQAENQWIKVTPVRKSTAYEFVNAKA